MHLYKNETILVIGLKQKHKYQYIKILYPVISKPFLAEAVSDELQISATTFAQ